MRFLALILSLALLISLAYLADSACANLGCLTQIYYDGSGSCGPSTPYYGPACASWAGGSETLGIVEPEHVPEYTICDEPITGNSCSGITGGSCKIDSFDSAGTNGNTCYAKDECFDWGCDSWRSDLDLGLVGKWDDSENKCVTCYADDLAPYYGKVEKEVVGDTSSLKVHCGDSDPDGGDIQCESACGASAQCDEYAYNATTYYRCDISQNHSSTGVFECFCTGCTLYNDSISCEANYGASSACDELNPGDNCNNPSGGKCNNSCNCACPAGKVNCGGVCQGCCNNSDCSAGQTCCGGNCQSTGCLSNSDCPSGKKCVNAGACSGTCHDCDEGSAYCNNTSIGCPGTGRWGLGGEVASGNCCTDDSGENRREMQCESRAETCVNAEADSRDYCESLPSFDPCWYDCCNNSRDCKWGGNDCVSPGTSYNMGGGNYEVCYSGSTTTVYGKWVDCESANYNSNQCAAGKGCHNLDCKTCDEGAGRDGVCPTGCNDIPGDPQYDEDCESCQPGTPSITFNPISQEGAAGTEKTYVMTVYDTSQYCGGVNSITVTCAFTDTARLEHCKFENGLTSTTLTNFAGSIQEDVRVKSKSTAAPGTAEFTVNSTDGVTGEGPALPDSSGSADYVVPGACGTNPVVLISPDSKNGEAGETLAYDLTITNNDSAGCASRNFNLSCSLGNTTNLQSCTLTQSTTGNLSPGSSIATIDASVRSKTTAVSGTYSFTVTATSGSATGSDSANYVVSACGDGSCNGDETTSNCCTDCGCGGGGLACCNNSCVNTSSDEANCGSCGNACPANSTCVSGTCDCDEANNYLCGGQCEFHCTTNSHCGAQKCKLNGAGECDNVCVQCTQNSHCNDSNPCTTDSCQGDSCVNENVPDGTACNSTRACCSGSCNNDYCDSDSDCTTPGETCKNAGDPCNADCTNNPPEITSFSVDKTSGNQETVFTARAVATDVEEGAGGLAYSWSCGATGNLASRVTSTESTEPDGTRVKTCKYDTDSQKWTGELSPDQFSISLTVTDDGGLTDSDSRTVSVSDDHLRPCFKAYRILDPNDPPGCVANNNCNQVQEAYVFGIGESIHVKGDCTADDDPVSNTGPASPGQTVPPIDGLRATGYDWSWELNPVTRTPTWSMTKIAATLASGYATDGNKDVNQSVTDTKCTPPASSCSGPGDPNNIGENKWAGKRIIVSQRCTPSSTYTPPADPLNVPPGPAGGYEYSQPGVNDGCCGQGSKCCKALGLLYGPAPGGCANAQLNWLCQPDDLNLACCGDGTCELGENNHTCPEDCYCGNNVCSEDEADAPETPDDPLTESCPWDCFCGRKDELGNGGVANPGPYPNSARPERSYCQVAPPLVGAGGETYGAPYCCGSELPAYRPGTSTPLGPTDPPNPNDNVFPNCRLDCNPQPVLCSKDVDCQSQFAGAFCCPRTPDDLGGSSSDRTCWYPSDISDAYCASTGSFVESPDACNDGGVGHDGNYYWTDVKPDGEFGLGCCGDGFCDRNEDQVSPGAGRPREYCKNCQIDCGPCSCSDYKDDMAGCIGADCIWCGDDASGKGACYPRQEPFCDPRDTCEAGDPGCPSDPPYASWRTCPDLPIHLGGEACDPDSGNPYCVDNCLDRPYCVYSGCSCLIKGCTATVRTPAGSTSSVSRTAGDALANVPLDGLEGTSKDDFIVEIETNELCDLKTLKYWYNWKDGVEQLEPGSGFEHSNTHRYDRENNYVVEIGVEDAFTPRATMDCFVAEVVENPAPVPVLEISPATGGDVFTEFTVDTSKSYDPNGSLTACSLDLGNGSTVDCLVSPVKDDVVYGASGTYTVTLTVTDNGVGPDPATKKTASTSKKIFVAEQLQPQKPVAVATEIPLWLVLITLGLITYALYSTRAV